jgi:peptidylprolyl isomerase
MSPHKSRRSRPRKKNNHRNLLLAIAFVAVIAVIVIVLLVSVLGSAPDENESAAPTYVRLVTTMGDIVIRLRDDMRITTANFKMLVEDGVYDGTSFHRVVNIPGNLVIIQGGDPSSSPYWNGKTIPSIPDEFSENPENNKNERGTIAMANAGPNTGSSQFFINGAYNSHLDNVHPVFGDVIEGMDVVDQITNVATDDNDRPVEEVRITIAALEETTES